MATESNDNKGMTISMSLPWAEFISFWANWILVAALIVGVAATWGIVVSGNVKEAASKREIARLSADAGASRAAAAEANARAIEAQLALERFKSDRTLSDNQRAKIVEKIREFAGQSYILSVSPDQEALQLMRLLAPIFRHAGWKQVKSPSALLDADTQAGISTATERGVRVQIAPSKQTDKHLLEVSSAMTAALNAEGIAAEQTLVQELDQTPDAIQIRVGSKPK